MKNLRRFLVLLVVSLSCALFATGCDDIISDPNFHTWCGDQLCSWKLESGEIRKAPTWHKNDTGVELLDSSAPSHVTAISQVVNKSTYTCLEFSVIADVAPEAQVFINVDFNADGTNESEQQIAAVGFRLQKTLITAPRHYTSMKFTIQKRGSGRAVLAQMDVHAKTDCTAPPPALKPQAIGTKCALIAIDNGLLYDHAACASGVCCEGVCAECCVSGSPPRAADGGLAPDPVNKCAGGVACDRLPLFSHGDVGNPFGALSNAIPRQCDPGNGDRPKDAECLIDSDCQSGSCADATWTLTNEQKDGGPCAAPPTPDPSCNVSSVHGGRCR